jgi:hypothetical protein
MPGDDIAISNAIFSYSAVGRMDTIAHEIGHNLGLDHCDPGCGGYNGSDLMASGGIRLIPQSLDDVYPTGLDYDRLTVAQIATVDASPLLFPSNVPEPGTLLLTSLGGLCLWLPIRRLRSAA